MTSLPGAGTLSWAIVRSAMDNVINGRPRDDAGRQGDVTVLLQRWREGDHEAGRAAIARVYGDLRRLAAHELSRERDAGSLQATELVHEIYLRLAIARRQPEWHHRGHFFAIASRLVRQVLIDQARLRKSLKRGGGKAFAAVEELGNREPEEVSPIDLLAIDQALGRLARLNSAAAEVVELRYFVGLTVDETALALGLGRATVERKWRVARAWLSAALATTHALHEATDSAS